VNAWGSYSKATTHALEWLHWRGLLRIARRERGIRVYRPSAVTEAAASPADRLRSLIMVYARILGPSPEKRLQTLIARHRDIGNTREVLKAMVGSGELRRDSADSVDYLSPSGFAPDALDDSRRVRFLAPFDPIVWDRTRFEHLWGWQYRFEAYTPVDQRVRGYYAMPLLWDDEIVGWVNTGATGAKGAGGARGATGAGVALDVQVGFVRGRPRDREFRRELDAEIARLEAFLKHERADP
jgi:uncharacterized protein YcaQ